MVTRLRRCSEIVLACIPLMATVMPSAAYADPVTVEVLPKSGSLGDSFTFTITVDGSQSSGPPMLVGGDDFKLSLLGRGTDVQIVNGRMTANSRYTYRLTPLKSGTLKTPAVEIEIGGTNFATQPIPVQITDAPAPSRQAADRNADAYLQRIISKRDPYVGEQITSSLEFVTKAQFRDAQFVPRSFDGFWSEEYGQPEQFDRYISGEQHLIVRRRVALYPLVEGKATIPSETLDVRLRARGRQQPNIFGDDPFDLFFGGAMLREVKLEAKPDVITVKPLPPAPADLPRLGLSSTLVGKTGVRAALQASSAKTGESVKLEVTVNSFGNLNPVKSIPIDLSAADVKVYEERPDTTVSLNGDQLLTKKTFRYTLVPLSGGMVKIPPVEIGFFDPQTGKYEVARSAPLLLAVSGERRKTDTPVPAPSPEVAPAGPSTPAAVPPPLRYEPESAVERLSNSVSGESLLFAITIVLGPLIAWLAAGRVRRTNRQGKALLKPLAHADTVDGLWIALGDLLEHELAIRKGLLTGAAVRSVLSGQRIDQDLQFHLFSVIDDLERAKFGGGSTLDPDLKNRVLTVGKRLVRRKR